MTGHLVLSTLHTNDAPNTVTRLVDMGLEAFKIGAALRGIIAQRLMRKLCVSCRSRESINDVPERLRPLIPKGTTLWKAVGCGQCSQTGFRGRFSVVELLTMNPEIERLIGNGANADQIAQAARSAGMRTLFECGLKHLIDGHTSVDELLRVTDVPKAAESPPKAKAKGKSKTPAAGRAAVVDDSAQEADDEFEIIDEFESGGMLAGLELVDEPSLAEEIAGGKGATTILIVEDEDSLRRVLKDLLEMEGYVIVEARDGAEAMEEIDRHNPDLVLLDLNLPNVDGHTVLRKLRAEASTEHLPVVVLTARGDEDNEVKVLKAGATDFITKPFRPKAFIARIAATIARSRI